MKRIAIFGYFGFDNTGDDSVLESMLSDLRAVNKEFEIIVFSNDVDKTLEQYRKYNIICAKWNEFELLNIVIHDSDLLIIGGGGLYNCYLDYPEELFFKGDHSYFSVINFELPYLARLYHVPCMVLGVGASRILSEAARKHIGRGLTYCDKITVRDEGSKEILSHLPFAESCNIEVTADPVFRLHGQEFSGQDSALEEVKNLPKPLIGVSLRNWDSYGNSEKTVTSVAEAINCFIQKNGGSVVMLPFDDGGVLENISEDSLVFLQLTDQLKSDVPVVRISGYLKPEKTLALIKECTLSICMRLHSIVMSVSAGVPVLGLEYDPKVRNMMKTCGIENQCMDIAGINSDNVFEKLKDLYLNFAEIKDRERDAFNELGDRAYRNIEYALELLENKIEYQEEDALTKALKTVFYDNIQNDYLQKIQMFFDNTDYQKVIELTACLSDDACAADTAYKKAFSYHQLGNAQMALKFYDMAMEKGFSEFWVRYNRGQLYISMENIEDAKRDLIKAYKINSENEDLMILLKDLF